MCKKLDREPLDSALVNCATSAKYQKNALFYFHILSQMNIVLDPNLPAPAGVNFTHTHFNLYINPEEFGKYSLDDRIFILVHECMHVLMGHLGTDGRLTGKNINHENANIAEDCSINQLINMTIPESAVMPGNMLSDKFIEVKEKQNSEYYYNLLENNTDKKNNNQKNSECSDKKCDDGTSKEGNGNDDGTSKEGNGNGIKPLDTHDIWNESEGDPQLQKDVTARLIENAVEETVKGKGSLPQNIEHIMNMFKRKSQIDWKKVLRNIVGSKKIGKRPTIMKKSRRFSNRPDIKGHTKDRKFDLVVAIDTSGSMDMKKDILIPLNEVSAICKLTNTSMTIIQVDTEIKCVGKFDKHSSTFKRKGYGGTRMEPVIDYLKDKKIIWDGLVFLSDLYIEELSEWKEIPKKPIFWLSNTPLNEGVQVQNYPRQRRFLVTADE